MRALLAFTVLVAIVLALAMLSNSEHAPQYPLVQAAAPSCPKLVNPCALIDCKRQDTKGIA